MLYNSDYILAQLLEKLDAMNVKTASPVSSDSSVDEQDLEQDLDSVRAEDFLNAPIENVNYSDSLEQKIKDLESYSDDSVESQQESYADIKPEVSQKAAKVLSNLGKIARSLSLAGDKAAVLEVSKAAAKIQKDIMIKHSNQIKTLKELSKTATELHNSGFKKEAAIIKSEMLKIAKKDLIED